MDTDQIINGDWAANMFAQDASGILLFGAALLFGAIVACFVVAIVQLRRRGSTARKFEQVALHANDGIALQQMDGTIIWCNDAFCKIQGQSREFMLGSKPQAFGLWPEDRPSDDEIANFRYNPESKGFWGARVLRQKRGDGTMFWSQINKWMIEPMPGERYVALSCRDVSDQFQKEEALNSAMDELERRVNIDPMTGLANRRGLSEFLDDELQTAIEESTRVGLLHIDLDKFKEINDTHGHAAGDEILIHAASAMRAAVRSEDLVARVGGDEFVVVVPGVSSFKPLAALAERLITAATQPIDWEGGRIACGASIGIAISDPGQNDAEKLVQMADFALYEVKANGRGAYACYDDTFRDRHEAEQGLAVDLAEAIKSDQIEFYFQPIFDTRMGRPVAFETLARWRHPERGLIPPSEFISLAEDNGILSRLDQAAMENCIRAVATVEAAGHAGLGASFNVSTDTITGPSFVDQLKWAADSASVPYQRLTVEVLETTAFGHAANDSRIDVEMQKLVTAGFRAVLDDFGFGYAGLAHLAQLPLTGIKVDRSMIAKILTDPTSSKIVGALAALANDLDLDLVAEGVETEDHLNHLIDLGCHTMQGYHFARPMPLDDLLGWLDGFGPAVHETGSSKEAGR